MDYPALVSAIESTTENTFDTVDMNRFIEQAERRVYNTVQFPSLRKNVTGSITAGSKYVETPADFLSMYSFAVVNTTTGNYSYLLNKDVNFLREAYPNPNTQGTPRFYAVFGPTVSAGPPEVITKELSLLLAPTADTLYNVEMHYNYFPESIVTAGTTWLGDNYDPALLYGALVEAYTFMKGEADMMAKYDQMFKDALVQAKRLGDGQLRTDTYRGGQFRQAVQ
jgi:hypothetical protein